MTTLDSYDQAIDLNDPDAIGPLEEAEITLGGKVYRLREVADIEITGGLEGLGEEEEATRTSQNDPSRPRTEFFAESACQADSSWNPHRDSRIIGRNRLHRRPRGDGPGNRRTRSGWAMRLRLSHRPRTYGVPTDRPRRLPDFA